MNIIWRGACNEDFFQFFLLLFCISSCDTATQSSQSNPNPSPKPKDEVVKYLEQSIDFNQTDLSQYMITNPGASGNRLEFYLQKDIVQKLQNEFKINSFKISVKAINASKEEMNDTCTVNLAKLSCVINFIGNKRPGIYNATVLVNDVPQLQVMQLSLANRELAIVDYAQNKLHFPNQNYSFEIKLLSNGDNERIGVSVQATSGFLISSVTSSNRESTGSNCTVTKDSTCTVIYQITADTKASDVIIVKSDRNVSNGFYLQYNPNICPQPGFFINSNKVSAGDNINVDIPNTVNIEYCGTNEANSKALVSFTRRSNLPEGLSGDLLSITDINHSELPNGKLVPITSDNRDFSFSALDDKLTFMRVGLFFGGDYEDFDAYLNLTNKYGSFAF